MPRVAKKKSIGRFKPKTKEKSSFCANCCQVLHEKERIFRASPRVSIKTAFNIVYNLDHNKHHFTQQEPEVVVLCGQCHSIFVNLFKFYSQFNGLRKVTSYLHKEIQHLNSLLQQIESPNNHQIKSQEDDDDASGGKIVNSDIDDDDVKMEISSTEDLNSDSDEKFYPSDKDNLTSNDITHSPSVESQDKNDTGSHSDSDDPPKIEEDEVTREQESTTTINSCQEPESDLSPTIQSEFTTDVVRVEKEKNVQNHTVIDLVTLQKKYRLTQFFKKDLNLDCKKCSKSFRSLKNLQIHQKYCAVSRQGPSVSSSRSRRVRVRPPKSPDTKECKCTVPGCNKLFIGSEKYLAHQKATHFVFHADYVTCTVCGKNIKSKKDWKLHIRCHENRPFKCPKCNKSWREHDSEDHVKTCKGKKTYSCDICGQQNFQYFGFKAHIRKHTGEAFKCPRPNCDKIYWAKANLREHIRAHDTQGQFKCLDPNCSQYFNSQKGLTSHLVGKHPHLAPQSELASQLCPVCGVAVVGADRFKDHMRSHREATFQCHLCPKAFPEKRYLDHHIARHEGFRTVPCTFEGCTKLFYKAAEVRKHMRTHTGEKNHLCPICGRASADPANLRKHMLLHSENKQFKCHFCDKAYNQPQALKNHLKIHER